MSEANRTVRHKHWGLGTVQEVCGRVTKVIFVLSGEKTVWNTELEPLKPLTEYTQAILTEFDQKFLKTVGVIWNG